MRNPESANEPEFKFVWRANKEGGQTVGNKQLITPVNREKFNEYIRPRLEKDQTFQSWLKRENQTRTGQWRNEMAPAYVSLIDSGKGWELMNIGSRRELVEEVESTGKPNGWVLPVNSFEEGESFRKVADSDVGKSQITMQNPTESRKRWQDEYVIIDAMGNKVGDLDHSTGKNFVATDGTHYERSTTPDSGGFNILRRKYLGEPTKP